MSYPKLACMPLPRSSGLDVILKHNEKCTIGRSLGSTHVLDNIEMSRTHCTIYSDSKANSIINKWYIIDVSANGTTVNTKKLEKNTKHELKHGDIIKLSEYYMYRFMLFDDSNLLDVNEAEMLQYADDLMEQHRTNPLDFNNYDPNIIEISDTSIVSPCVAEIINQVDAQNKPNNPGPSNEMNTGPGPSNLFKVEANEKKEKFASNPSTSGDGHDVEEEVTCSICTELFIKSCTLNCGHCFCTYCIEQWKKNQKVCPICRAKITTQQPQRILDNIIDKLVDKMSLEDRKRRGTQIQERDEEEKQKLAKKNRNKGGKSRRGAVRGRARRSRSTPIPPAFAGAPPTGGETIELSSGSDSDIDMMDNFHDYMMDSDETDYEDYLFDNPDDRMALLVSGLFGAGAETRAPRRNGGFYGGYGSCYICHQTGHWANGCPLRAGARPPPH